MSKPITLRRLVTQSLTFYWRTNVAVVLGIATAVAVLAGALLVGDSVRGSLRDLVLLRIGNTDQIVMSTDFMRETLAADLLSHPDFARNFEAVSPIVMAEGLVTTQTGNGRANQVRVYGVDDRFWRFHGVEEISGPEGRQALLSPALAEELGTEPGATILVRVQRPSEIPLESIHGNKEDVGRTIRASVAAVVPRETLGDFSLEAAQGDVYAVFLPLRLVQQDLDIDDRVNLLLVSTNLENGDLANAALKEIVRSEAELSDLGLSLRLMEPPDTMILEGSGGLIGDDTERIALEAGTDLNLETRPMFTYLVNSLGNGRTEIPYSLVTATDLAALLGAGDTFSTSDVDPIVLSDWAANDLGVSTGDRLSMEYYVWEDPGQLLTRTADFEVAGVVPIETGDRAMAPNYPGITDSSTVGDWDPPFPIDLGRIRPVDEEYWNLYRTTPKAFIPLEVGRELWRSRYGSISSIRFTPNPDPVDAASLEQTAADYAERLGTDLDSLGVGLAVRSVRSESIEASRGATNFSEYFVYFSFFLVVSALLLAALFFKLSVEQRGRELGLLRSVGYTPRMLRRLFLMEGLVLSSLGAIIGVWGGVGYAWLLVSALGTWWVDAVGTTAVSLHVSNLSLAGGAAGGVVAAMVCIWATLGGLGSVSERRLLAGQLANETVSGTRGRNRLARMACVVLSGFGVLLIAGAGTGFVERAAGFFGAGMAFLAASLCFLVVRFGRRAEKILDGQGWWPVSRLGLRNVTYRPARSVTAIGMIASATFILISVDAFRRDTITNVGLNSGLGGYTVVVDSLLPLLQDPTSIEGQALLGLDAFDSVAVAPFRVRPGDDASCLNLYEPTNPRIVAPSNAFIEQGRFAFLDSQASNEAERANPWQILHRVEPDGAIPVIADANSMTYVLHRELGEEIVITQGDRSIRLRLVAALDDSIFQGELVMSEEHFLELFPEHEGYRLLLVETEPGRTAETVASIESALVDFGGSATGTADRLAQFHQVENTYLSTFQMLGGLGLLLGTIGLGAVLLRNVLERRRELALMRALGYQRRDFLLMSMAESLALLVAGLLTGAASAFLATAPVIWDRGGQLPGTLVLGLLGGVLIVGLVASLSATVTALRSPLLPALREE